ncbi:class C sortase [Corynebacterium callunae]|uniref:class C sortase n=1 Tax=Corynebacterium callunae TaxID=1721 RepID=UPI003981EAA1
MGVHTFPAPRPASAQTSSLGYKLRFVVAPIVLVVIGLTLLLAPVMSTQYHNWQQTQAARAYSAEILQQEAAERTAEWESAQAWNALAPAPQAQDPWNSTTDHNTAEYQSYLEELNILPTMARVRVPAVDIDLPVYHGTDELTLAQGVGHLYGTDLPVGGVGTHAALTGHTGISTASLFDNLIDVSRGDLIAVDVLGETLTYRVTSIATVLPDNTESLRVDPNKDLLTLITCTPYGINSHRLVVTGERVFGAELPAEPALKVQPWILLAVGLSAVIIIITFVWILRRLRGPQ